MSELVIQDNNKPVDVVAQIGQLAQRGYREVVAYSMAFDRLPDAEKEAHIARLHDMRDQDNLQFINMFRVKPVVKNVLVRNADGTPFISPVTGDLVWEQVEVADITDQIVARLAAPVS